MSTSTQSQDAFAALAALCGPLIRVVVEQTVVEVLHQHAADEARLGDQIGLTEPKAAALIDVQQHVLRDARRRGEISARLVGKKYVYERAELLRFLREY